MTHDHLAPGSAVILSQAEFAVVDIETTGFSPTRDAIVEIAVVHLSCGSEPELALDTLVDPRYPHSASLRGREVHGIAPDDLVGAPTIEELAPELWNTLAGRVVVAHNASFDLGFLELAYTRMGATFRPPYVCTLALAKLLGTGSARGLDQLAAGLGLSRAARHAAAEDAALTAFVLESQLGALEVAGLASATSLTQAAARRWDFSCLTRSHLSPLPGALPARRRARSGLSGRLRRDRFRQSVARPTPVTPAQRYFEALGGALLDLILSPEELSLLQQLRCGVSDDEARAAHAAVMSWALVGFARDGHIDEQEVAHLREIRRALSALGWAPGD